MSSISFLKETKSSYSAKPHSKGVSSMDSQSFQHPKTRQLRDMYQRQRPRSIPHAKQVGIRRIQSFEVEDDPQRDHIYRIHRRNNSLPDITTIMETEPNFWYRKLSCKRYSLQRSQSVEWDPISALFTATTEDDTKELERILTEFELNVNFLSPAGVSLLHTAAAVGSAGALKLLLDFGAEVEFQDDNGRTTLEIALLAGNFDCASLLINSGACMCNVVDGIKIFDS